MDVFVSVEIIVVAAPETVLAIVRSLDVLELLQSKV